MKPHPDISNVVFLAVAALLFATASAEPGPERALLPNVIVDVQIVAVPEALAWPLIPGFSGSKEAIEKAFQELTRLIAEKRAVIVAWPRTIGKSGERVLSQQVEEIRFATSYEAPQVAWTSNEAGVAPLKLPPKIDLTQMEAVPKDFATAPIGIILEAEAEFIEQHDQLDVDVHLKHTRLLGFSKVTIEKGPAEKVTVEQPRFHTNTDQQSLTLKSGERVLLGVHRTPVPADHVEFSILRATVTRVPGRR